MDGLHVSDICSVASLVKGYQALLLLTVHQYCHAGREPGNEASTALVIVTVK